MLSRRKLFGFLAAAPVVGAAATKALAKAPEPMVRVVNQSPQSAEIKIRSDRFIINLSAGRMEIMD